MDPAVASTDIVPVIGILLTLVSLLGSFFYIHLSDWLRDVIALETKWDLNKDGDQDDRKAARRECRYEIKRVAGLTMLLTSLVVSGFVFFISILGWNLLQAQPENSLAWKYIGWALVVFLVIYLGMTGSLLVSGYVKAHGVRSAMRDKMQPKKKTEKNN